MSTVYQEGPFRNWVEVAFGGNLTAKVTDTAAFRSVEFAEYDKDTGLAVGPIGDPSFWQAVIRGVDSGAEVDFRLISIELFGLGPLPVPTACDNTPTNYYNVPSGTSAGNSDVPGLMGYISGVEGTTESASLAALHSFRRLDYNAGAGLCNIQTDATALPAFINGEKITVSAT